LALQGNAPACPDPWAETTNSNRKETYCLFSSSSNFLCVFKQETPTNTDIAKIPNTGIHPKIVHPTALRPLSFAKYHESTPVNAQVIRIGKKLRKDESELGGIINQLCGAKKINSNRKENYQYRQGYPPRKTLQKRKIPKAMMMMSLIVLYFGSNNKSIGWNFCSLGFSLYCLAIRSSIDCGSSFLPHCPHTKSSLCEINLWYVFWEKLWL
jgi:hypothetical protein